MKLRYEVAELQAALRFLDSGRSRTKGWTGLWLRAKQPNHAEVVAQGVDVVARAAFEAEVLDAGQLFLPRRVRHTLAHNNHKGACELFSDRKTLFLQSTTTQLASPVIEPDGLVARWKDISPDRAPGETFALARVEIRGAIDQVMDSVAQEETRGLLTGVSWTVSGQSVTLAATDAYRLALKSVTMAEDSAGAIALVVPSNFMRVLSRILKQASPDRPRFSLDSQRVIACFGNREDPTSRTVESWPIPGDFPNYAALAPETPNAYAQIPRDVLLGALKRARAFGDRSPVVIQFERGLTLTSGYAEHGLLQEQVDAEVGGNPATVAFNPRFLLDGVMASKGSELRLEVVDDSTPAALRSVEDKTFLYVVMPVRLEA